MRMEIWKHPYRLPVGEVRPKRARLGHEMLQVFPWTKVHYPFQQLIFFFFIHLCGFRRWEGVELDEVCQVAPLAALDVDGAESPWP